MAGKKEKIYLDAEGYIDKRKTALMYGTGILFTLIGIAMIVWAIKNWEAYSYEARWFFSGAETEDGLAPRMFDWGLTFTVIPPFAMILSSIGLDINKPQFGVSRKGVFINHKLFRRTWVSWNEIKQLEKMLSGDLKIHFNQPEKIIARQPFYARFMLTQTYVTRKLPFLVDAYHFKEHSKRIIELIEKYYAHYQSTD